MKSIWKVSAGARLPGTKRRTRRAGLVMMSGGSLALGLIGTASAASASGVGGSARPAAVSASSAAAAYYVTPSIGFSSASATFVVPKATCKSASSIGQFDGLFDLDPADGNVGATALAAVDINCDSGSPAYEFETYIAGESNIQAGIAPGNTVVVSIAQTASTELSTVTDVTTKTTVDVSNTPVSEAAVSVGAYSTVPTEKFTPITFTKVQVNGQYLKSQPNTEYNLLNGAKTLIKTSPIASPGDSFSVTYEHAS